MWKSPLYVRIDKNQTTKQLSIGAAAGIPLQHASNTLVVLKLDLELDQSLFDPAFDTQTTIKIDRQQIDMSAVVAGLKQIDKDVKDI